MITTLMWMLIFPFLGSAIIGGASLLKGKVLERWAGFVACFFIFLSFLTSTHLAYSHLNSADSFVTKLDFGNWIHLLEVSIPAVFQIDSLSSVLALIVTGIGFLIHVYSLGYMAKDSSKGRYFACLNLFCGFMLILLTASSLPVLFIGWEGVGLCSYLLIGFWYEKKANTAAGRKAFIVNRIGDAAFFVAMVIAFQHFGTLDFLEMRSSPALSHLADTNVLEIIGILLFIGCIGKSAQFPLYVWLPDAMAGPTPVSALIHAATMVTAGVYLLARMAFLYDLTSVASEVVAVVGAFTALFAATIALAQRDIKKVLAFSTISQLGFMVLAMGVGAYAAGIFHLVTHAYFKALLFLAAGSIIHALRGEQDIYCMGGLRTYLILTTLTFLFGYLAIIGFPLFSGWFSKDAILHGVSVSGNHVLFWLAFTAALLTAAYMTRLFALIFLGLPRISQNTLREIHEAPGSMILPMAVLALFAFIGGIPWFSFEQSLNEFFVSSSHADPINAVMSKGKIMVLVTLSILAVTIISLKQYLEWKPGTKPGWVYGVRRILSQQYFWDMYVMKFFKWFSQALMGFARLMDVHVIDAIVNGSWKLTRGVAVSISRFQTGTPQTYVVMILLGSVVLIWALLGQ